MIIKVLMLTWIIFWFKSLTYIWNIFSYFNAQFLIFIFSIIKTKSCFYLLQTFISFVLTFHSLESSKTKNEWFMINFLFKKLNTNFLQEKEIDIPFSMLLNSKISDQQFFACWRERFQFELNKVKKHLSKRTIS
jgi:hypothetical protein